MSRQRRAMIVLLGVGGALSGVVLSGMAQPPAGTKPGAPQPPAAAKPVEPPAQAVNVRINGEAVPFTGQGAIQRGGAVLVPLRGIFQRLGADVKYDGATGTITATKLDRTVTLKVGDLTGYINGEPRILPAPATIYNGAVLIPLRLVSDAFGAVIEWDSSSLIADIKTDAINAQKLPTPPSDDSPVQGTLTGVYPEINALTVRVSSSDNVRVLLAKDYAVQIRQVEAPKVKAVLNDLRLSDQVVIQRDKLGFANSINVLRDLRRGVIKEKNKQPDGGTQILFTNGATVVMNPKAPVLMSGNRVSLDDVGLNETVVVRIDLDSQKGISGAVVRPDDPNPIPPSAEEITPVEDTPPPGVKKPDVPVNPANPAAAVKPEVMTVTHDAAGKMLKSGDAINVTVTGTPGAKATVTVAGLISAKDYALTEKADMPGTYNGMLTIPVGVTLKDAMLTATLTIGEVAAPVATAPDRVNIDSAGPEIMGTAPEENATLTDPRPRIYGAYADAGSKVDLKSIQVLINGDPVAADITPAFFTYTPKEDLPAGKITVTVIAKDMLGNESRKEWSFTSAPPEKPVRSLSVTPKDHALRSDEQVTVRLEGMAGGTATFKLGPQAELPMREDRPGVYIGTYTVKKGDVLTKAPVIVNFTTRTGDKLNLTAPETVTLAAGAPIPPIIDYPAENLTVRGGYVVFSGRAAIDVKVKVVVRYTGKNLVNKGLGNTLTTVEVQTDAQGNWKTDPILLDVPGNIADLLFSAEVTAVREGSGETSAPATVRFRKL